MAINGMTSREAFNAVCAMLENHNLKYEADASELKILCGIQGEDFPVRMQIIIDDDHKLVALYSQLPFEVQENKRIDMALAISQINNHLADGSFDYDMRDGSILFRLTLSYIDSIIGEDALFYQLLISFQTIDEYNDKLFLVSNGSISIEDFLSSEN
jgi:hypothetical protein